MSLFLVDLQTPGVSVLRRETMNRWTLSDVRFEGVRVDASSLLGTFNCGWQHMAAALVSERSQLFHVGWAARNLDELVAFCRETRKGGAPLAADPEVRHRLARLHVELGTALRFAKRVVWMQDAGHVVGHEAAIAKLYATELLQRMAHTATTLLGPYGALARDTRLAPIAGRMAYEYIERVHPTISVGSNEIQRNAIAAQGLGMPRQPR
jgi:alkylation response protein AidB-like acyl-CoA dehydrogenase